MIFKFYQMGWFTHIRDYYSYFLVNSEYGVLSIQTVRTLTRCQILWHTVRVCTVCLKISKIYARPHSFSVKRTKIYIYICCYVTVATPFIKNYTVCQAVHPCSAIYCLRCLSLNISYDRSYCLFSWQAYFVRKIGNKVSNKQV